MLRNTFFAVLTVLTMAASSHAAIMLTSPNDGIGTDVGQGLMAYDLTFTSDPGQTMNGLNAVSIVANNGGAGLHQVWSPVTNSPTPTRGDHTPPLWNDAWLPFDSYLAFAPANSLSIGAAFTETNVGDGAPLPDQGFGAPNTGFGTYSGPGSKSYTIASGNQGNSVNFGQLVLNQGESVLFSGVVLTNEGNNVTFTEECIGACEVTPGVLSIVDAINTPVYPGKVHEHQFGLELDDSPVDPSTATWELLSLQGPGGEVPTNAASLSPSGLLSWVPNFADLLGETDLSTAVPWTASVRATLDNLTDDGTKRIELFVPEPGTAMLLSLAIAGVFGFIRRR